MQTEHTTADTKEAMSVAKKALLTAATTVPLTAAQMEHKTADLTVGPKAAPTDTHSAVRWEHKTADTTACATAASTDHPSVEPRETQTVGR